MALGIDVAAMVILGMLCVLVAIVICGIIPLAQEQGESVVVACAFTALAMVVGYVVIANVLNAML